LVHAADGAIAGNVDRLAKAVRLATGMNRLFEPTMAGTGRSVDKEPYQYQTRAGDVM
jgi:hypothetical protein